MSIEGRSGTVAVDEQDSAAPGYFTYTSKTRKIRRTPKPVRAPTWNRDKQTIIVPAMKGYLERIYPLPPPEKTHGDRNAWHALGFDTGANPACGAEAGQIGREAVGDVHHCSCGLVPGKPFTKLHRDSRIQMLTQRISKPGSARQIRSHKLEAKLRSAQLSCDIYKVTGTGTRTPNRSSARDLAEHGDADRDRPALGCVSTYQAHSEIAGRAGHPGEKGVEPCTDSGRRQSESH
jgi:hypothetical protein